MTRYLDVQAVCKLIRLVGIEPLLRTLADYVASDYGRWSQFEKSARAASHFREGVVEIMPISDGALYSFKYVNGHPANTSKGLPTVMAFGVLAESSTGLPLLLSEMTVLTALRTAATSALAASKMARAKSTTMAVIGCGAQSEFQILAFKAVLGITLFRVYDVDPLAIAKVRRNLASFSEISIYAANSVEDCAEGVDVITTLTAAKVRASVITAKMVRPGIHINAVGGDCPGKTELDPLVLANARVVVEYAPQSRIEGEIQQLSATTPFTELWQILSGSAQGREDESEITIFDSVGFALEDFSALRYFNDLAISHKVGSSLDLIPNLENPKDLYQILCLRGSR